jgi:hypothetical protein
LTTALELELEARFARRVGERLHATVVLEAERSNATCSMPCCFARRDLFADGRGGSLPVAFSASRTSFVSVDTLVSTRLPSVR